MSSTPEPEVADVCIVGLGYVGLTLATAFALAGLRVAGVERSSAVVGIVASGLSPFHEDGLDAAIAQVTSDGRLTAVDTESQLPAARAYVITVGTPVKNGDVWLGDLENAVSRVADGMPDGSLVVLRSTVRVGTTSGIGIPSLAASGKTFHLAMAPERTIEGRALQELRSLPQIVGGVDEESTNAAASLFARLGVEIVRVGSAEAAELAKLSSNTYRDLQFAFANELAYLADTMDVDVFDVIRACNYGYDRMNLALPGPVAGPCLEKDAYILADSARAYGVDATLSMAGRRTNEALVAHVSRMAKGRLDKDPARVAILGIAFKGRPATSDVRGSMAEDFAAAFVGDWPGAVVVGWDPLVSTADAQSIGIEAVDLADAVSGSQLVVVQTNHQFFSSEEFAQTLVDSLDADAVVIDLWNQLPSGVSERADIRVLTFGRSKVGASS